MIRRIEVEGWREFQFAVRRAADRDLPKRLGQANKRIGEMLIGMLDPKPSPETVGTGRGANVRPSASKREVQLRVGGTHRAGHTPEMPWGRRWVTPARRRSGRPYLIETADNNRDVLTDEWLEAVADAMRPAFHRTEP